MNSSKRGFLFSIFFHVGLILLAIIIRFSFGPASFNIQETPDCTIPLDIVDIAEISVAPVSKPKVKKPKEQKRGQKEDGLDELLKEIEKDMTDRAKEPLQKEEEKPAEKPNSKPEIEDVNQLISELMPELKFEKQESEKKQKEKPKKKKDLHKGKKKEGSDDEDFMQILKDMSADSQKGPSAQTPMTDPNSKSPYGASAVGPKMAISITDRVRRLLQGAWRVPMRAHDRGPLVVVVSMKMSPDGSVQDVDVLHDKGTSRHPAYRVAVESALRAIQICSPLPLPADQYAKWKTFQFRFIRE